MISTLSKPIVSIKGFINKGNFRSVNAKKNIVASFIIKGCSIGISLVLVPLTIHYVNPARYGIWLTLSSVIGWFTFFDIGFGHGLRNRFAEALAKGEHEMARIYVSTTYAVMTIIVAIALIVFFVINPFLDWSKILNTSSHMAGELSRLALLIFSFFCLEFVLQLITTVLTANQQSAKASFFNLLGSVFSLLVIFILTKTTSGNLIYLGAAFALTPVLVLALSSSWFYTHEYKLYAPSLKYVRFSSVHNLVALGAKFFVIQIAFVILYQTSNIIIAQLFGPAQVTPYNIAFKYFSVIPMAFSIIITPFWSAFTEAFVKKDITWINSAMKKLILTWVLFSIISLIMLIFSNKIYELWVGRAVEVPFLLSATIASYVILNTWCGMFATFLNGVGKLKLQLLSSMIGALVNIPLAIFLGKQIGIAGVVLSTCLLAVLSAIWVPIQYHKIIHNKAHGIWNK